MGGSPCDVNGAVSGKAVGSQPLELRGWMRIRPDRTPDVVLEPIHVQERLFQPQVILQPARISTNSQSTNRVRVLALGLAATN